MSTYVIGDLQGCYDPLRRLLDLLHFNPAEDRLWFAGDLVNRGPQSLLTLRYVRGLGSAALTVLGNHDLHLLAVANGGRKGKRDTLEEVLTAPDRDELLDWLRRQPLLQESGDGNTALLHAGLPPQWDLATARACAREVEAVLRSDDYLELLKHMYGDEPLTWDASLSGIRRLRFIVNCYTRLRYCDREGRADFGPKGAPGTQGEGLLPWFAIPQRRSRGTTLLFGHWSTLGRIYWPDDDVYGLDTGAVWGGKLTALRLEDRSLSAVESPRYSDIE
ncbi:symmetrical bis(5'-nucleosyl)-tetraphosphatase [Nevskia soli]|uniref:symmetrical bis(5'-nucleosyl)-tetraphosphatase n=1 Tax=Nevskia soli TaxID=418856 RepID=UPI0004A6F699|nr:symmetrical bis(5'-nucleosyl)-tetraphosphatase [Nevskia soli]